MKTKKGLATAVKKARARFEAWQCRYHELLNKFYLVAGNPACDEIGDVYPAWTLYNEFSPDEWESGVFFSTHAWKDCFTASEYFTVEAERIWRRVRCSPFDTFGCWQDSTAYALRRMKTLERRMQIWRDRLQAAETALEAAIIEAAVKQQ